MVYPLILQENVTLTRKLLDKHREGLTWVTIYLLNKLCPFLQCPGI